MIHPKKHVVEYTVLDLCDETYYDSLGFKAYELLKTPTGPRVFTIVCLNAKRNDNEKTHGFLLEDYERFRVPEFGMDMTVQQIADLSYAKNLPVMATVAGYQEKCVILASCQRLWADWFASIFIEGYDELEESLRPVIIPLLIEHNSRLRQSQHRAFEINDEIDNIPLGTIMDEAVDATPRIACYRVRAKIEGYEPFTDGLVICASKGTSMYDELVSREPSRKTIPACQMRTRTIGATLRQTAGRMHDIGCLTTAPDLYLFATINPATIDYLESMMEDLQK